MRIVGRLAAGKDGTGPTAASRITNSIGDDLMGNDATGNAKP